MQSFDNKVSMKSNFPNFDGSNLKFENFDKVIHSKHYMII